MNKKLNRIGEVAFLFFFFFPSFLFGQNIEVEELMKNGDSLLFIKKHDDARVLYENAIEISEQTNLDYLKYLVIYKIGYSYLREGSEFLAMAYFTEIQLDFIPQNRADSAIFFISKLENDILSFNCIQSNYNPLVIEQDASRFILLLGDNEQARLRFLLSLVYVQRLENKLAIEKLKLVLSNSITDPWLSELSLNTIANQYRDISDEQKAIEYYKLLEGKKLLYTRKEDIFGRLWLGYYTSKEYVLALQYLKKEVFFLSEDNNSKRLIKNYECQGTSNIMLNRYSQAIFMFDRAEALANETNDVYSLTSVYTAKLYAYRKRGDSINTVKYLSASYNLRNQLDISSPLFIYISKHAMRYYYKQNQLFEALRVANEYDSLLSASNTPKDNLFRVNYRYLKLYKGLTLRKIWEQDSSKIHYLEQAHETFKQILAISQEMYANMENEKSKLQVISKLRIDFENFYLTTQNLYLVTKSSQYLDELFILQQKGKAILFKSIVQESGALFSASIPESILQEEARLKKQIERLSFYLNPAEAEKLDNELVQNIRQDLIQAKLSYDSLVHLMEKDFPVYRKQKSLVEECHIKEIQEVLEDNQLVIDYFVSEGRLFKILIKKSESLFFESRVDSSFQSDLIAYRNMLQYGKENRGIKESQQKMFSLSNKLYKVLLGDIETYLTNKRLFIVPDVELSLIPFETLLVENVDSISQQALGTLPYLIKNNPISILYSQSQLLDKTPDLSQRSRLIGFAPDYSNFNDKELAHLSGAQEEVERISSFFKSKIFIGSEATKNSFLQESQKKYDIIHLALHTNISDENAKYSQLIFSYAESPEDCYLTSYEVHRNRFKSSLLVLSGCNTGSGELKSGEGVMHLARSFFFAGIKNIVLTQWAVADNSSASLMEYFYKYLAEGNSVDVALQKAKIDFLLYEDPIKHHPYYWAGYTSLGQPAVFVTNNSQIYWLVFILLVIITITLSKWKISHKNSCSLQ